MRYRALPLLAVLALFSVAVVVPFLPAARRQSQGFALEVTLASTKSGRVQVYFDRGNGIVEDDSSTLPLPEGAAPRRYRLPMPGDVIRAIRFDPIDRDGIVTLADPCVVDPDGRRVRTLALSAFKAANQIQSLRQGGGSLEIVVPPGGGDPQLSVDFGPPLQFRRSWGRIAAQDAERAAAVFAACLLAAAAFRFSGALRRGWGSAGRWFAARPGLALMAAAAAAVAASSYPVIFFGRSYVSPQYGAPLLYDGDPTLPGYRDPNPVDVRGSDVGAIIWQSVPYSAIQHRALLRDRELPVWNRYDSTGTPLLGQGQSMFGDPLHFLAIAADGAAWAWDVKYLAAKWLFAFGLGWLVFSLVRHLPSALLVAAASPFVGFFVYRVNHPAIFSLCYSPWPLLCWVAIAGARGWRGSVPWYCGLIVANVALIDSGTAKEAYMLLLSMNAAGACVLLASSTPLRVRLAKCGAGVLAGGIFALLTAPAWYVFVETLGTSYTSYDNVAAFQIQPSLLLGAFDEAFYRTLEAGRHVFNPSANFVVLAGLLYFLATLRSQFSDRAVAALAVFSLLPASLAFGFVPPDWVKGWPLLSNIGHLDNTFTCVLIVLWAVLAGAGFSAASRRLGGPEGRGDLAVAGLLLFALVFQFTAFRQAVHRLNFGADTALMTLKVGQSLPLTPFLAAYLAVLIVALVAFGLLARRALREGRVGPAAGVAMALCLLAMLWRGGMQVSTGFEDYVVAPGRRVDFRTKSGAVEFLRQARESQPSRAIGLQNNLFPGWSAMYGIETANGPDALINRRYRELLSIAPINSIWDWRLYLSRDGIARARPFLDFLNVRYYLDLRSDQAALGALLKPDRMGDLDVYESPTAWPRAFFTDRVELYRDAPGLHGAHPERGRPPVRRGAGLRLHGAPGPWRPHGQPARGPGRHSGDRLPVDRGLDVVLGRRAGRGSRGPGGGLLAGISPRRSRRAKGPGIQGKPCLRGSRGESWPSPDHGVIQAAKLRVASRLLGRFAGSPGFRNPFPGRRPPERDRNCGGINLLNTMGPAANLGRPV